MEPTHYGSTCGHLNYVRKTTLQNIPVDWWGVHDGITLPLQYHLKFGKFKAPFVAVSMEFR